MSCGEIVSRRYEQLPALLWNISLTSLSTHIMERCTHGDRTSSVPAWQKDIVGYFLNENVSFRIPFSIEYQKALTTPKSHQICGQVRSDWSRDSARSWMAHRDNYHNMVPFTITHIICTQVWGSCVLILQGIPISVLNRHVKKRFENKKTAIINSFNTIFLYLMIIEFKARLQCKYRIESTKAPNDDIICLLWKFVWSTKEYMSPDWQISGK